METMVLDLKSEWRLLAAVIMLLAFVAMGALLLKTDWSARRTVPICKPAASANVSMSASPYVAAKIGVDPSALARAEACHG
jgi:hypothetical protein